MQAVSYSLCYEISKDGHMKEMTLQTKKKSQVQGHNAEVCP